MSAGPKERVSMSTPRVQVWIYAEDPISQAGVSSQLRARPEIQLVPAAELDQAEVAVVVAESIDENIVRVLRAIQRGSAPKTVLIGAVLDEEGVVVAAEAGVCALLRRSEVTSDRLVNVIGKVRAGRRNYRPICWPGCSDRSASCSGRSWRRGACVSPGSPSGRSRCSSWSPKGWTRVRSPADWRSENERSRASCMTSPPGCSCETVLMPWLTPSGKLI